MNTPRIALIAAACAAMLLTAACGGGSSKPAATATPKVVGALDALGDWVRANRNVDFVGECASAKPGVDVGKVCATPVGSRGTRRAYSLGPTFSEGTGIAILDQKAEGWTVLSVKNRDLSVPAVPGIDWPLQVGDQVVVIGLGNPDCLRVREQPTQQGKQLGCEYDGTKAIVQEGPIEAETFTWWRIAGDGFNGWAAGTWLRLPEAIAQALATPVPPTATP
jgi:hypothetical protein